MRGWVGPNLRQTKSLRSSSQEKGKIEEGGERVAAYEPTINPLTIGGHSVYIQCGIINLAFLFYISCCFSLCINIHYIIKYSLNGPQAASQCVCLKCLFSHFSVGLQCFITPPTLLALRSL